MWIRWIRIRNTAQFRGGPAPKTIGLEQAEPEVKVCDNKTDESLIS
jgi:hypothetical protein